MFKSRRTRQLEQALRKLADACALTLPGLVWSDEIDEAVALATELIGPMGEEGFPAWRWVARRRRQKEREDQAWSDGYNLREDEVEEFIADKDAFIAQQADLIQTLIEADLIKWDQAIPELRNRLADYV